LVQSDYRGKFAEVYSKLSTQDYLHSHMPEGSEIRKAVTEIIRNVDKARLYRGKGGEVMRGGVCHLIRAMAISRIQLPIANE
jgi:hypothetical protein